ncbi:hypothetical protein AWV79_09390 [Cupriavidus sp. UYMMa02A]|nr:hypothetical protein AWV79_09390 [Cupriavidus sp. UYMMa02A]
MLRLLEAGGCDVVVLGYAPEGARPEVSDTGELRKLLDALGPTKAVLFGDLSSRAQVQALMGIGVKNIVSSFDDIEQLLHAVLMACHGMSSMSHTVIELLWGAWRAPRGDPMLWRQRLSERELEVLHMFLAGKAVSEIARETGRNVTTISTQKKSVMRKMRVKNDVQLVAFSIQQGLL